MSTTSVLSCAGLSLDFVEKEISHVVTDLHLSIAPGEKVALIGESGCGKTVTALSAMGLGAAHLKISGGTLSVQGECVNHFTQRDWCRLRGNEIAMIFQEPMTALNPLHRVGVQIAEAARLHGKTKQEARSLALTAMAEVGLPDPERLYTAYPHELSGGMRQRIMIAMALINRPALLIADEPTTALDVTTQAQILELIRRCNEQTGTALLLISHDLGVVRHLCDRIYIMYAGMIVEYGGAEELISHPRHPYTCGLLDSIPSARKKGQPLTAISGTVPALGERAAVGCPFAARCKMAVPRCTAETPVLPLGSSHGVRCFREEDAPCQSR